MLLLLSDAIMVLLYAAIPLWLAARLNNEFLHVGASGSPLPLRLSLGFSAGALAVPTLVCILLLMEEHGVTRIPKGISPAAIGSINLVLVLLSLVSYAASRNSSLRSLKRKFLAANVYALFMCFWFLTNLH
jgi:hypothetical protein